MSNSVVATAVVDEISARQNALARLCNERSYPITSFIQSIGLLVVVDQNLVVQKVSENITALGLSVEDVLGCDAHMLFAPQDRDMFNENAARLYDNETDSASTRLFLKWRWRDTLPLSDHRAEGFVYRSGNWLCLEAELPGITQPEWEQDAIVSGAMNDIAFFKGDIEAVAKLFTHWMRKLIGFDRLYCFQFDAKKNGVVIGESLNDKFPSLQDHHFPATDIPTNLHEIYKRSRFRYLADRESHLVGLVETAGASGPLDLSLSVIRQISPSHLKYLANMNVEATLSFSIVIDDALWGLVGGHHSSPRVLPFRTLVVAQQLVEMFASKLQVIAELSEKQRLKQRLDHILELSRSFEGVYCDFGTFATEYAPQIMDLVGGDNLLWMDGSTPSIGMGGLSQQQAESLIALAKARTKEQSIFGTPSLVEIDPSFIDICGSVAGVLALAISEDELLIWTRKEQIRQRKWGGNPNEGLRLDTDGKVGPRHSFATWVQQVRYTATPWEAADFRAAEQLRLALTGVKASHAYRLILQNHLLQKEIKERMKVEASLLATSDSLRETNKQLESFAYVVSHDLQEPLRMIASYSQLLEKRYGHQLEGEAHQYLAYAVDGAKRMRTLIDAILEYSCLVPTDQRREPVNLMETLAKVQEKLAESIKEANATIDVATTLPILLAEETQIYQLFQNLIANALKFRTPAKPVRIEISAAKDEKFWRISVKDNGIGIPADMQKKVFEMFQRLSPREYAGTGIGLATCQRIVELHGGRIWCDSVENEGTTFFFTLPVNDGESL